MDAPAERLTYFSMIAREAMLLRVIARGGNNSCPRRPQQALCTAAALASVSAS